MNAALRPDRISTPPREVSSSTPVRIMIVDDSLTVRTVFSRMIAREPDMTISAMANDAERALSALSRAAPDVLLLDLEMPGMGGLEALPRILETAPSTKVLVVSSLTADGAEHTVQALSLGAADTMLKPRPGEFDDAYRDQLLTKIRALRGLAGGTRKALTSALPRIRKPGKRPDVVAIGASTGGIHALNLLLKRIPATFDLPILLTQHLPASFMPVFARQMELAGRRLAVLAHDGVEIARNQIIIAPGHGHLVVRRSAGRHFCGLAGHPVKSGCMPSVDPMFETLAEAFDGHVAGVLLSGMGRDGSDGAKAIIDSGGTIFAQDAQSCAVWGMPRDVTESGLAAAVLPPEQLADKIAMHAVATPWR